MTARRYVLRRPQQANAQRTREALSDLAAADPEAFAALVGRIATTREQADRRFVAERIQRYGKGAGFAGVDVSDDLAREFGIETKSPGLEWK